MSMTADTLVRHHLLELILWPNDDGTFREITNSSARLIELGIYYDYKLTITMTAAEHNKLHRKGRPAHNRGKPTSASSKYKNRLAHLGKSITITNAHSQTPETRAKISSKLKGKCKHNLGRHWKLVDGKRVYY